MQKSVLLSVRISQEESEILAKLEIPHAVTPSEKIRALLQSARKQARDSQDYSFTRKAIEELIEESIGKLSNLEVEHSLHSEVVDLFANWLPDATAYFASQGQKDNLDLNDFEKEVLDRIIRLFTRMMGLAVTENADCYDPKIMHNSLKPIIQMAQVIKENS